MEKRGRRQAGRLTSEFSSNDSSSVDSGNDWIFTEPEFVSLLGRSSYESDCWNSTRPCSFISALAKELHLPASCQATAKAFLHRFYTSHPFEKWPYYEIAAACAFVAIKLGDSYRKLKDLVRVAARLAAKNPNLQLDESGKLFRTWRHSIMFFEELVLEAVSYDLELPLPHASLQGYLARFKVLGRVPVDRIARLAFGYCNDAMDTTLYLRYPPATIAAAAVQAACKTLTRVPEGEEDAIAYMRQNPLLVDRQGVACLDIRLIDCKWLCVPNAMAALGLEIMLAHDEKFTKKFAQARLQAVVISSKRSGRASATGSGSGTPQYSNGSTAVCYRGGGGDSARGSLTPRSVV